MTDSHVADALLAARHAEKEQALFYRALAAAAENINDAQLAEDLNGLHADEQHHLSRLSVRLLELDQEAPSLNDVRAPMCGLNEWRRVASVRERAEIARYESILALPLDDATAGLINEILDAERMHASTLGGKYMDA